MLTNDAETQTSEQMQVAFDSIRNGYARRRARAKIVGAVTPPKMMNRPTNSRGESVFIMISAGQSDRNALAARPQSYRCVRGVFLSFLMMAALAAANLPDIARAAEPSKCSSRSHTLRNCEQSVVACNTGKVTALLLLHTAETHDPRAVFSILERFRSAICHSLKEQQNL
jgi:hypothetical protein